MTLWEHLLVFTLVGAGYVLLAFAWAYHRNTRGVEGADEDRIGEGDGRRSQGEDHR